MKCLESTIPFGLLAILALPVSCTSNPGTISGMTDAGTDTDTDTDTDADTDTGTGADAGPPDDLFGGYGRVALVLPAHSKIEEATIVEGAVETPPASIDISIPLDDSTTMLTLHDGILKGDIDPIPDTEMLGGRLVGGMICGSVDRGVLGDVLADALELGPIMQGTLTAFLATIAARAGTPPRPRYIPMTGAPILGSRQQGGMKCAEEYCC